jgi:hypothetical protein
MNVIGLPMTISLVLARQAGVSDPALDKAIDKSARFLRYYVDKGAKALEKDAAHQQVAKEYDMHVCNWECHYRSPELPDGPRASS